MAIEHLTTASVIRVVKDNVSVVAMQRLKIGNARQRGLLAYLQLFDLHLHFIYSWVKTLFCRILVTFKSDRQIVARRNN